MSIIIKTPEQIEKMRVAGHLAAEVLHVVRDYVKPGVTTGELDRICHEHIVRVQGTIPANVGYGGGHGRIPFPAATCTSVNNVICHGIPSESKVLKDGDIVNIDVTVIKDGWHGDTSRMYVVGKASTLAQRLVDATREAMWQEEFPLPVPGAPTPRADLRVVDHVAQTMQYEEFLSWLLFYTALFAMAKTPQAKVFSTTDELRQIYKKIVVSADGKRLIGAVLVGDAAEYSTLQPMAANGITLPADASGAGQPVETRLPLLPPGVPADRHILPDIHNPALFFPGQPGFPDLLPEEIHPGQDTGNAILLLFHIQVFRYLLPQE